MTEDEETRVSSDGERERNETRPTHLDHALLVVFSLEVLPEEHRVDLRSVVVEVLDSLLALDRRLLEMAAGLVQVERRERKSSATKSGKTIFQEEMTNPLVDGEVREAKNVVGVLDRLILSSSCKKKRRKRKGRGSANGERSETSFKKDQTHGCFE